MSPAPTPKERGILLSAPMVRALLAGRKTQTRRLVKPQPIEGGEARIAFDGTPYVQLIPNADGNLHGPDEWRLVPCPYGHPGDRLWVKETHALLWPGEFAPERMEDHRIEYRADTDGKVRPGNWSDAHPDDAKENAPRWRPAIYMPRWASRLLLEVTEVRVERVQGISEDDAEAEGLARRTVDAWETRGEMWTEWGLPEWPKSKWRTNPRAAFSVLWDDVHGPGAWERNDWVWVICMKWVTP